MTRPTPPPARQRARRAALARCACAAALPLVALPHAARADPPALLDRASTALVVRRAVERAGLDPGSTRDLARRARARGWIPHVSVRVARGFGAATTLGYQTPERASVDDSFALDVQLSFGLDRVVFAPEEVAIARLETDRAERRIALERDVIDLLASLERARIDLARAPSGTPEAARCELEVARATARLEALVGAPLREVLRAR